MAVTWTLARLIDKVRDDLELHGETFVTSDDLKQFVHDAIDDAEEIVIDARSDFLLTYDDLEVEEGDTEITLPSDIYESRIRGFFYSASGFSSTPSGEAYKIRQIRLEDVKDVTTGERYRYRLINSTADGQELMIYPAITEDSTDCFRLFYIRHFKRPEAMTDELEKGLRPQYIISHVKCKVMQKEGNALLEAEMKNLMVQEERIKKSLSSLTDDDEGVLLEPDDYALSEAYGYDYY